LCIGLLLSIVLSSHANILFVAERMKYLKFLMLLLLISLIPAVLLFSDHMWVAFGHSMIVLAFGCMLLVVQVQSFLGRKAWFLGSSFLRYLGLRCYSIYLFHGLFNIIAVSIFKNIYVDFMIVSILTLLFAHFSWRYIELPLIQVGRKFSYRSSSKWVPA
jgi:peptidoglycan/LPS O-acetylase OafA/YrhL